MANRGELALNEGLEEPEAQPYRPQGINPMRVPDRFEDRGHYVQTFSGFLNLEIEEEKSKRDYLSRDDYPVLWQPGTGAAAQVQLPSLDDLSVKDQLRLIDPHGHSADFSIMATNSTTSSIYLRLLNPAEGFIMSDSLRYRLEFTATRVHLRMLTGLQQFEFGADVDDSIANIIMGITVPEIEPLPVNFEVLTPPNHPLNQSQVDAVEFALTHKVALIRGPPGTGKTTTAAAIIYNLLRYTNAKVLVCAPSNIAVDHLTLSLRVYGDDVKALRIYSRTMVEREGVLLAESSALHWELREKLAIQYPDLKEKIRDRHADLSKIDGLPHTAIERLERDIVNNYHVICCTTSNTITRYIRTIHFGAVVLDEAGYATEPDALLPVLKGIKRFVMLGDENQLPPFVKSKQAISIGYGRSMFERLVSIGVPVQELNVQYRMHPDLAFFSNREIYRNRIENGVVTGERHMDTLDEFWGGSHPVLFYHVQGVEESVGATSYRNVREANILLYLLHQLLQLRIHPSKIGLITPYEGQRAYLSSLITSAQFPSSELEIKNIDGFQGREKDIILISCVRANMESELGFLHNKKRLNVAITRAKYGLVIVGNMTVLQSNPLWRELIKHIKGLGQLKDGDAYLRAMGNE